MLSGHQRITWRRNIADNFNRMSRVHERYRRQTTDRQTDRQTDGRTTTCSRSLKILQSTVSDVIYTRYAAYQRQLGKALQLSHIVPTVQFTLKKLSAPASWSACSAFLSSDPRKPKKTLSTYACEAYKISRTFFSVIVFFAVY